MSPSPFVFGKVPARGDFVRAGRLPPLLDELDEWLQRGLLALRQPPPDAPPVAFVFVRPAGTLLGALRSSRDRSGRVFPLVVGGTSDPADGGGRTVAGWGPFLGAAADAAADVVGGAPPEEALAGLGVPAAPDAFLERRPGDVFGEVHVEAVLRRLPAALAPLTMGGAAPRYGLGLPLPAEPAARPAAVAAWRYAVARRAGGRTANTLVWTAEGPRARLALFLGAPTADALAYLFAGTGVDGVYDVDVDPPSPPPVPRAPTLRALLDRP